MTASHLIDLFRRNRDLSRDIVYLNGEHEENHVSFAELERRASAILHRLQLTGGRPGDRLIIFVNDNEHFIQGLWGGIFGGIIPVPVAPVTRPCRLASPSVSHAGCSPLPMNMV